MVERTLESQRRSWRQTLAGGLLRTARPKQWAKNLLVLAAPGAAGVLGDHVGTVALAFVAFCLASSGTYYLNDVADLEADRRHPLKRQRPIPSGVVSVRLAVAVGVGLILGALALAWALRPEFFGMVALYLAFTTAYSIWLKHLPIVDLAIVAAGFLIRAIAGGVAVDVPISRWFLIVASFASLFMVIGKRVSEGLLVEDELGGTRPALTAYSRSYLLSMATMTAGVTVTAYCLWAFEQAARTDFPWFELTIIPFVLAVLRYGLLIDAGRAGAPEDVLLSDRAMQVLSVAWAVAFAIAIHFGR